jgi:hypothetical protein
VELMMIDRLLELMRWTSAPAEQFERLGLPATGRATAQHLAARGTPVHASPSL